eukprot:IDg17580t1
MYSRHSSSSIILIAFYVEDILIAANSSASFKQIKGKISMRFEMKDMGEARECLGLEIYRDRPNRKQHVSQKSYTETVLERFGMQICKPVATPMETSKNNPLSLFSGAQDLAGDSLVPVVYSDSDWDGCLETGKSASGYVFVLAGGAVSWRSRKQTVVVTSSCEAKYIASCLASKEALWLSRLLSNVHGDAKPKPITIHIDNSECIATAQSTSINPRNKHYDIQYHFVRDNVASGKVMLEYVRPTDQLADPMTKPLDRVKTERFASLQGILPLDS